MAGSVGAVRAVFSRTGVASLGQSCGGPVLAGSPTVPPPQPRGLPPLSRVAASPDGKYVAGVSADARTVYVWASGSTKAASTLSMPGVTAIRWDRRDYLWVAQGATISMVVQTSTSSSHDTIPTTFPGKVLGLAIAPDGVRVAAIVQTASGPEVELAAIDSGAAGPEQLTNPFNRTSIGPVAQLAPNVTNPIALTWYDADNLLVLDGPSSESTLWKVPLDGQPAVKQPGVLPGAISITANSASNALVLGLTNNRLDVSASLEGPWQPLFVGGQNPAFPTPASPVAAQS
jgi:hypothetical protein